MTSKVGSRRKYRDIYEKYKEKLEIIGLEKVEDQRNEEMRIRRCLEVINKENLNDESFREMFIKKNKNWLNDNISSILSPSTIFRHRAKLLNLFNKMGYELKQYKEYVNSMKQFREKKNIMYSMDAHERDHFRDNMSTSFQNILKMWLARARRLRIIRSEIAGVLEQSCEPECSFCGCKWGLKCESIGNVEDIFEQFLNSKPEGNYSTEYWKTADWQKFFLDHAALRTSCYDCLKEIMQRNPTE